MGDREEGPGAAALAGARAEQLPQRRLSQRRPAEARIYCLLPRGTLEPRAPGTPPSFPLLLQFTAGYSMVLNLLYTRSMEEARAFLDRSFSKYLGAGQGRVTQRLSVGPLARVVSDPEPAG